MAGREILVAEDEIKIAEILKDYLVRAGYRRGQDEVLRQVLTEGARRRSEAASPPADGEEK